MPGRGQFITLEGGEGAGKSTLARAIGERLVHAGHEVVLTREPGGVASAEAVRELVLKPQDGWSWTPLAEALLFNAARAEHLDRLIRPSLGEGKWVVCDRFADSTRAYQMAGSEEILSEIQALEQIVVGETRPTLTLILDLAPELGRERMLSRGIAPDGFESRGVAFHQRVRDAFLAIADAEPERCVVLDASQPSDLVLEAAFEAVVGRCGLGSS